MRCDATACVIAYNLDDLVCSSSMECYPTIMENQDRGVARG